MDALQNEIGEAHQPTSCTTETLAPPSAQAGGTQQWSIVAPNSGGGAPGHAGNAESKC
eukprot:COSAG01_NODE_46045_length_403_cov_4.815789_1_plen_57_part_01